MPLLNEAAYRKTFGDQMLPVADGEPPFPFWPYFDEIPQEDFRGYDCNEGIVRWIWRSDDLRFEHVCISTKESKDVYMVVVLDLLKREVLGHRLMDFESEYGRR